MTTPSEALAAALNYGSTDRLNVRDEWFTSPLELAEGTLAALSSSGWSLVLTEGLELPATCLGTKPPYHVSCKPSCHDFDNAVLAASLGRLDRCEAVWDNAVGNASIRCFLAAGHLGEHDW